MGYYCKSWPRHDAWSRAKPWAHREASRMEWSGPELDTGRGSWGQGRNQRPGEEMSRTILPQTQNVLLNAELIRFFLKAIVFGKS